MFKKDNRYVTREVNEEVDIRLQLMIWSMLDKLKDEGNVELDYLQIFKIRKDGNKIVSYGLSSFGYDVRLAPVYKVFTNHNADIIDPLNMPEDCYIDKEGPFCVVPPNNYLL